MLVAALDVGKPGAGANGNSSLPSCLAEPAAWSGSGLVDVGPLELLGVLQQVRV